MRVHELVTHAPKSCESVGSVYYAFVLKGGPRLAGMWTFCYGQPLINSFTRSGWPNGIFPDGPQNPFNNFADRVW